MVLPHLGDAAMMMLNMMRMMVSIGVHWGQKPQKQHGLELASGDFSDAEVLETLRKCGLNAQTLMGKQTAAEALATDISSVTMSAGQQQLSWGPTRTDESGPTLQRTKSTNVVVESKRGRDLFAFLRSGYNLLGRICESNSAGCCSFVVRACATCQYPRWL